MENIPLENFRGQPRDLIQQDAFVAALSASFRRFLLTTTDNGSLVYGQRINDMCSGAYSL